MRGNENRETIADIVAEFREMVHKSVDGIIAVKADVIADRIEAAWKREREEYREAATSEMLKGATIIDNRSIGNAIINTWKYPLTNLGHRGNQNRGPKTPVAIVRDAEGCVLMTFLGEPYRTNAEAIAKASEFCAAMNELHERVGNATTTGNAAAMREALIIAKKAICHHAEHVCRSLSWENSNIQSNCADILCAHRDLCEAKTAINAALSAPPRNCDRFKSVKEAAIEFSKRRDNPQPCPDFTFSAWLFATAEPEAKGVGDGRK